MESSPHGGRERRSRCGRRDLARSPGHRSRRACSRELDSAHSGTGRPRTGWPVAFLAAAAATALLAAAACTVLSRRRRRRGARVRGRVARELRGRERVRVPTQLVLVPMLFAAARARLVPLLVAAGSSSARRRVRRPRPRTRSVPRLRHERLVRARAGARALAAVGAAHAALARRADLRRGARRASSAVDFVPSATWSRVALGHVAARRRSARCDVALRRRSRWPPSASQSRSPRTERIWGCPRRRAARRVLHRRVRPRAAAPPRPRARALARVPRHGDAARRGDRGRRRVHRQPQPRRRRLVLAVADRLGLDAARPAARRVRRAPPRRRQGEDAQAASSTSPARSTTRSGALDEDAHDRRRGDARRSRRSRSATSAHIVRSCHERWDGAATPTASPARRSRSRRGSSPPATRGAR